MEIIDPVIVDFEERFLPMVVGGKSHTFGGTFAGELPSERSKELDNHFVYIKT